MNNSIHVEVQIIKLLSIRIGFCDINWDFGAIVQLDRSVFNDWGDDLGILVG